PHAGGVERAAHELVADARKILHAAASDQHDRVLLKVVTDPGDVGRDLDAGRQADTGDLAQRGVRLLRGHGVHARADAAPLRRIPQGGGLGLRLRDLTSRANQLLDRGHGSLVCTLSLSNTGTRPFGRTRGPEPLERSETAYPPSDPSPEPESNAPTDPPSQGAIDKPTGHARGVSTRRVDSPEMSSKAPRLPHLRMSSNGSTP